MTTETDPIRPDAQDELHRARLERTLAEMDIALTPYAFEVALARVTTATKTHGNLGATQIEAIIDDVLSSSEILQGVAESFR